MNSKNIKAHERKYLATVKSLPCGLCDAPPPSDAHHIEQGNHFLCIPLCKDCHQGSNNGIHGRRNMWRVMKKTELDVLNETLAKVLA
ncbi:hypothetical protein [uncultured Limnobacter sp.]|uniref:hypothetical protein n=1 Tax=uncultured Limnobacter sp. TaxID=199681 RepID=UPI0030F7EEFF